MNHTRLTVSVVDDDESVRESLPDLLNEFGFRSEVFSSAEAFLHANSVSEFSCLILDVAMPGMTGSQLAEHVRSIRSDIPILLMSGYAAAPLGARAAAVGAVEVLNKPLVARDMARSLELALRKRT